jgi:hypothetical protein
MQTTKLRRCGRCGWPIAEGTYHYPHSKTYTDRMNKKFTPKACDIFKKGESIAMAPIGSAFGR